MEEGRGTIRAAVVDRHDLEGSVSGLREDGGERFLEPARAIEDGHDEAHPGFGVRHTALFP